MKKNKTKQIIASALAAGVVLGTTSCMDDLTIADFIPDDTYEITGSEPETTSSEESEESADSEENNSQESEESVSDDSTETTVPDSVPEDETTPTESEESKEDIPGNIIPEPEPDTPEEPLMTEPLGANGGVDAAFNSYAKIVDDYGKRVSADLSYVDEFCRYFVVDLDGDGTAELLVETGTCEADRLVEVYSYDGTEAKSLGSFVTWHSELAFENGVLYSETAAMGSYTLNKVVISGGAVVFERGESSSVSRISEKLPFYSLNDASGLNAGSGVQQGI